MRSGWAGSSSDGGGCNCRVGFLRGIVVREINGGKSRVDVSVAFAVIEGEKVFSPKADGVRGESAIAALALCDLFDCELGEALVLLGQSTVLRGLSQNATVTDAARAFLGLIAPGGRRLDTGKFPGCYYAVGAKLNVFAGAEVTLARLSEFFGDESFKLYLRISGNAGEVMSGQIPGVSFRFNSKESGSHHVPHVHVSYKHGPEFSVSLIDGRILVGGSEYRKLTGRIRRAIDERIGQNREELLRDWNSLTDGIRVDVDALLGQVDCSGLG